MLLDGHLRIEILKDIGLVEVECLFPTDDEAFTHNKRISPTECWTNPAALLLLLRRGSLFEPIDAPLDRDEPFVLSRRKHHHVGELL